MHQSTDHDMYVVYMPNKVEEKITAHVFCVQLDVYCTCLYNVHDEIYINKKRSLNHIILYSSFFAVFFKMLLRFGSLYRINKSIYSYFQEFNHK